MNQLLADRLARARARCPELRLGQLIVGMIEDFNGVQPDICNYVTDEALVGMIEDFNGVQPDICNVFRVRPPSGTYRLDLPPLPSRS